MVERQKRTEGEDTITSPFETSVRAYFERMAEIRSTGGTTSETSYYSALENLLNELGKLLKPRVICNGQLRNQGAGHPDFALYSSKQCRKGAPKPGQGEIPERGVIEVKPLADNSWQTAQGEQATKYYDRYGGPDPLEPGHPPGARRHARQHP